MTRTSSLPARASAATCATVAATSAVSVLVIDCTTIGWAEPTETLPTRTVVVLRRVRGGMGSNISGRFGHARNPSATACPGPRSPRVATYVPDRIVTNADLSQRLDTSDEWIVTRTGIRERRAGAPGETTASMGAEAVRRLMAERSLGPGEIEALIVATVTPDMVFPRPRA